MKIVNIEDKFFIKKDVKVSDKLDKGVYLLHKEVSNEYYLQKLNSFEVPSKIYGEEEKIAERYLNTFSKLDKNMGILLTGLKGNGKSLTAKIVSIKSDLPTILISECYKGVEFKQFLQDLKQEAIIFIDEFEKIYPNNEENNQEEFLSILDGVFESKKLFIFTTNSFNINEFLKNRPNRIRYLRRYSGLDKKVIEEVIEDKLQDKNQKNELMNLLDLLGSVSMDVLDKLIQEMNLYDEPATVAIKYLNIQIEHNEFDVLMYIKGKRHISKIYYNPIISNYVYVSYKENDEKSGDSRWRYYEAEKEDLTMEVVNSEFVFKDRDGNKLIFTPSKTEEFQL